MTKYEMFKMHRDLTQVIEKGVSKNAEQKLNEMLGEVMETIMWVVEQVIENHTRAIADWAAWAAPDEILKRFEVILRQAKCDHDNGASIYPFEVVRKLNPNGNGNPNEPREVD